MPDLPLATLRRLIGALDRLGVRYAIVGGIAVSIRAAPRFTADIDAVVWVADDGWEPLLLGLQESGLRARPSDPIAFARRNRLLLLKDENSVPVDVSLGALPFEANLIETAGLIEIAPGLNARIASAECLIIMKAIAWRPKDLLDIREIVSVVPNLDVEDIIRTFADYATLLDAEERVPLLVELLGQPHDRNSPGG